MDDLYEDLENYNDVNVVEELRNENLELKQKIENYASAMDKLQRDFDELAAEFKKLEMNYSSLLKTARDEIERKTQTITNLNIEKDAMVLNAIQNQGIGDYRRLVYKSRLSQANNDPRLVRKDKTDYKTLKQEKAKEVEGKGFSGSNPKKNPDFCENKHKTREFSGSKPSSIHSRRKSMSALRCENKFNASDDEYNQPLKQYEKRNNSTSQGDHRQSRPKHRSSKGSGSSADEKYCRYKESSLETFHKSKDNRHYDSEHRKTRHRYETERYFNSPERLHHKATRYAATQYNDFRHTQENRYSHRSKSHDRRTYYDTNYDRDYYHEGYEAKHKIQDECYESRSKRMKYSSHPVYPDERVWQQETHYTDEELLHKVIGDIQYTSCQSPDMNSDHSAQPITEIKLTSEVPLEDPRLKSKNYSVNTNEDKVILSTVNKEVNLKPINKCSWNIQEVMMPEALQHPPEVQNLSETLAIQKSTKCKENSSKDKNISKSNGSNNKDIGCMEISKSTPSSSKLVSDAVAVENKSNPDTSVKPAVQIKASKVKTPKTVLNVESNICSSTIPIDKVLPKPKQTAVPGDITKSIYENMNTHDLNMSIDEDEIGDLLLTGLTCTENNKDTQLLPLDKIESPNVTESKISSEKDRPTVQKDQAINKISEYENVAPVSLDEKSRNISSQDITHTNSLNQSHNSEYVKKLTNKEIVARDLELSDETNDNQDFQKRLDNQLSKESSDFLNREDEKNQKKLLPEIDVKVIRILSPDEEIKTKGKVKTKKTRLSTKKSPLAIEPKAKTEKKTKLKKNISKISTPMKNKFSDLFGDSSSLITPEDLGLGAIQIPTNYEPIIEDAQDALDLKENCDLEPVTNKGKEQNVINDKIIHEYNDIVNPGVSDNYIIKDDNKNVIVHSVPIIQVQEPDKVKTVIISTGMQPQLPKSSLPNDNIPCKANTVHDQNRLIALATSTPHKSISEPSIKLPEDSCNSNDSKSSSYTNSVTPSIQDDIPDVRIFLKRKKRRVIKKS